MIQAQALLSLEFATFFAMLVVVSAAGICWLVRGLRARSPRLDPDDLVVLLASEDVVRIELSRSKLENAGVRAVTIQQDLTYWKARPPWLNLLVRRGDVDRSLAILELS